MPNHDSIPPPSSITEAILNSLLADIVKEVEDCLEICANEIVNNL
jgi:hypothetical protein